MPFFHSAKLHVFSKFSFSKYQNTNFLGSFPSCYEPCFQQANVCPVRIHLFLMLILNLYKLTTRSFFCICYILGKHSLASCTRVSGLLVLFYFVEELGLVIPDVGSSLLNYKRISPAWLGAQAAFF